VTQPLTQSLGLSVVRLRAGCLPLVIWRRVLSFSCLSKEENMANDALRSLETYLRETRPMYGFETTIGGAHAAKQTYVLEGGARVLAKVDASPPAKCGEMVCAVFRCSTSPSSTNTTEPPPPPGINAHSEEAVEPEDADPHVSPRNRSHCRPGPGTASQNCQTPTGATASSMNRVAQTPCGAQGALRVSSRLLRCRAR
jgi:hypothetical protein